jgi:hypothetical protein
MQFDDLDNLYMTAPQAAYPDVNLYVLKASDAGIRAPVLQMPDPSHPQSYDLTGRRLPSSVRARIKRVCIPLLQDLTAICLGSLRPARLDRTWMGRYIHSCIDRSFPGGTMSDFQPIVSKDGAACESYMGAWSRLAGEAGPKGGSRT